MKKIMVYIGLIIAVGVLYACGGGSDSKSTTTSLDPVLDSEKKFVQAPPIGEQTNISTAGEASAAVSASKTVASSFVTSSFLQEVDAQFKPVVDKVADDRRIISSVSDLLQRFVGVVERQKATEKQVALDIDSCLDGGTMSGNATVQTYKECKAEYESLDGTISFSTPISDPDHIKDVTITLNLTTVGYAPGGYTSKEYELIQNITMEVNSIDKIEKIKILTIKGSGSMKDYISNKSYMLKFGDFKLNMAESASDAVTTTVMTMDGAVSINSFTNTAFTAIDTKSGISFENFKLVSVVDTINSSLTINGTYAIITDPACMDGTFVITTPIQFPIVTEISRGITTSGQMTVNDVVVNFNEDGEITIEKTDPNISIKQSYSDRCSLSL